MLHQILNVLLVMWTVEAFLFSYCGNNKLSHLQQFYYVHQDKNKNKNKQQQKPFFLTNLLLMSSEDCQYIFLSLLLYTHQTV